MNRSPESKLAGVDNLADNLAGAFQRIQKNLNYEQAIRAATRNPRPSSAHELVEVVRVDAPWGWTRWKVTPKGFTLWDLGVIRPGSDHSTRTLANIYPTPARRVPLHGRRIPIGTLLGAVAGVFIMVGVLSLGATPNVAALAALGVALVAGIAAAIHRRLRRRLAGDCRRFTMDQAKESLVSDAVVLVNEIGYVMRFYEHDMRREAAAAGLDPLPLPMHESARYLTSELHQAVWDLASGESANKPLEILFAMERTGQAVRSAIMTAWATWNAAAVPIPPDPALHRPTVERLQGLTTSILDSETAGRSAAEVIHGINNQERA